MSEPVTSESQPSVLAVLDNLFFVAKIKEATLQAGLRLETARSCEQALTKAKADRPVIVLLDLDATACQSVAVIHQFKADESLRAIPLLGFVSHVQTDVQAKARQAGCDRVLARSAFSRDLPRLLKEAAEKAEQNNV
jgi:PleD family two-component response regulator